MLSRASSNSRLRRSKSSASVKTRRQPPPPVPEPFDPQAARLHALTAASLAMGCRPQHCSRDSEGSFDQTRESDAETLPYSRRRHSTRTTETSSSATSHSLAVSRSQTPLRNLPTREESLDPVPEQPIQTGESGFLDDVHVPSAPSSYRRVRKSKSMFGAGLRDLQNSPRRDGRSPRVTEEGLSRKTLRRSLSFFKGKSETAHAGNSHSDNSDIAVRLAREQFLQGLAEQQRLEASEPASGKRNQREQRPFRKSFRSTSASNSPNGGNLANGRSRDSKSKTFSTSIKNGFRRLFGRSSASQDGQSFASMVPSPLRTSGTESPPSNSATVVDSKQTPRAPPRHRGQPELEQHPRPIANRPASLRTVKSSESVSSIASGSSWADSTAANTIATRHGGTDHGELPAILENSGYQQAERAPSVRSHRDGYSVSRQTLQRGNPEGRAGEEFDTQRVYSALMRRIDQRKTEKRSGDDTTQKQTKTKTSELPTPGTARSIRPGPGSTSATHSISSSTAQVTPSARGRLPAEARQYQQSPFAFTPQQIAHYNEDTSGETQRSPYVSQSTRARNSPVPPGTPTPYGHGGATSRRQALDTEDDSDTIIVNRPTANFAIPQSPSAYSRTTSGASFHADGDGSYPSDSEDGRGTATILASHRVEYSPTRRNSGRNWDRVGKGSAEWKQWMSSQMDIINSSPVDTTTTFPGHYREGAQINDDGFQLEACVGGHPSESQDDSPPELQDTETTRPPLVELPSLSQSNNFSRPLRRSPSGLVSLRDTPVQKPSITAADHSPSTTAIITNAEAKTCSSKGSSQSRSPSKTPNASPLANHKTESPGQMTTPTRDIQRNRNTSVLRSRLAQYRTPPLATSRAREENAGLTKENQNLHDNHNSPPLRKHTENDLAKLENIHSTIGSKRMVDIFLSDRRRQMGSDEEDEAMPAEPAFL